VDESGADLVIARDYISRGMRSRAEDLVTRELGPMPGDKQDENLATIRMRKMTPAA
jgi:type IV secretory pathway VirD2 relaxase